MLKAALVPMTAIEHIPRNNSGEFPSLFISGEFIALRIGNRLALRLRTTMLKKYRGIRKECAKNQKVAVRKRTDFAMSARFLTVGSPLPSIWPMAC
jgi:hypothetical protein